MAHIKAQDVADDGLVDGIMGCYQDRLAFIFLDVLIEGGPDAATDIFQGLAALPRHGDRVRCRMPALKFLRIVGFDIIGQPPFPIAVIDFQEAIVF